MKENKVKSGKEILNEFFDVIQSLQNVDKTIAETLAKLYKNNKLSDKNIANELQKLREGNANQD